VVRLEQYYPFPAADLQAIAAKYPGAKFVWVQDEPENQGAWPFMVMEAQGRRPACSVRGLEAPLRVTRDRVLQEKPGGSHADSRPRSVR
jgi:2-oxoglutarate decarboxylase